MARISTYALDAKPEINDKVIGTDNGIGEAQKTKNYSLGEVMDLFNERNLVAVADQAIFKFQDNITDGRDAGTISFDAGGGLGIPFADITSIVISKRVAGGKNITNYLPLFIGKDIILAHSKNINEFGTYKVTDIQNHATETGFWDVTLENYYSHGFIGKDAHYIFSEFTNPASDEGDKHFTYTRLSASNTWNITHNLDKFPSVSVVDSGNNVVIGDIQYTNTNELTITFNASFSGKAYLN